VVNVLLTSAGRRVELLRAFVKAQAQLGLNGHVVAVDANPLAPALQETTHRYVVPRINDSAYIPHLRDICRDEDVGLIFPTIDPDIPILAEHRPEFESVGAKAMVVGPDAAETAADKLLTYRLFSALGVPVPATWDREEAREADIPFPAFIKPRRGSSSENAMRVRDRRELEFFLDYIPNPMVQELLPGPEITSDVICGISGEVLGVISRQRIESRAGEVQKGTTVHDDQLARYCRAIAVALNAVGPITVQCMMKNGEPFFTEVNCRYGGGAPLGFAAGANSPLWLLSQASGVEIDIPKPAYRAGLFGTRFDDAWFLTQEQLDEIPSGHIRS
jgi:carbamoyl-phosphate synthase large subunit